MSCSMTQRLLEYHAAYITAYSLQLEFLFASMQMKAVLILPATISLFGLRL